MNTSIIFFVLVSVFVSVVLLFDIAKSNKIKNEQFDKEKQYRPSPILPPISSGSKMPRVSPPKVENNE